MSEFRGVISAITVIVNKNQRHALQYIQILLCLNISPLHYCFTFQSDCNLGNNIPQQLCLWMLTSQQKGGRNMQYQLKRAVYYQITQQQVLFYSMLNKYQETFKSRIRLNFFYLVVLVAFQCSHFSNNLYSILKFPNSTPEKNQLIKMWFINAISAYH